MDKPFDFFYHHICHVCKLELLTIKKCSGCKLVSYCSQMHQKQDWKYHRSLCLCVRKFLEKHNLKYLFVGLPENEDEWRRNILSVICTAELELKRPLMTYEKQMFMFPDMCPVCFVANCGRNFTCEHCFCVRYCSEEHRKSHYKKHETDCPQFKICYEIDKKCFESHLIVPDLDMPQCNGLTFPASMDEFLNNYFSNHPDSSKIILSEHFSGALSLIFAINSSKSMSRKNELDIHIVGASIYEQSLLMTVEMLFHRFSHLQKINLTLIGPEICENYLEPVLCEKCNSTRKLNLYKENKFYHQYNKHSNFVVPDVIFSYNCGFSEVNSDENSWQESIKDIWKMKQVLFAFTSYTKSEAKADFSLVLDMKPERKNGVELLLASYQNPFKSLRPYRNWEFFECSFFYNNNFIGMVEVSDQ